MWLKGFEAEVEAFLLAESVMKPLRWSPGNPRRHVDLTGRQEEKRKHGNTTVWGDRMCGIVAEIYAF